MLLKNRKKRNDALLSEGGALSELKNAVEQVASMKSFQKFEPRAVDLSSKRAPSVTNNASKPLIECDPDVGIFACSSATDTRCVPNSESTLGGFCMTYKKARAQDISRSLQDGGLCGDLYIDCDCSSVVDGVGSYTCTRPDECIDSAGNVCGTFEDVVATNADGSYSSSHCFVAQGNGAVENISDSPLEEYCYTVVNDGTVTTQCILEIDQVECNSCTPILCPGGSTAASLDCTNINAVAVGNSCQGGLNVLELLSGSLTSAPTASPTLPPTKPPTLTPPTASGGAGASTPVPTSEVTSDASTFMPAAPLVVIAAVAGVLVFVAV